MVRKDSGHLGALLLEEGIVTQEALDRGLEIHNEGGLPLARVLLDEHLVDERDLVRVLARSIGLDFVDLREITVDPAAAALIAESLASRYAAIPIGFEDDRLVVAMADPANVLAIDDIRAITGREVIPKVATRSDVDEAIQRMAALDTSVSDLAELAAEDSVEAQSLSALDAVADEAPVVKLVNMLITRASADRASDIHIEPTERDLRVRFRIDGVLHEIMRTPRSITNAVVSRLKIMADIDIAERRRPQDGRINLRVSGRQLDLRVSTLPTIYGEKVVMRLLDTSTALLELEDLGFSPYTLKGFAASYEKPYGTILVVGPTGSGKSTTLYATLNVLNKAETNIITIEDPVEYRLPGVNQVQVNRKAGLTFASGLRSFLRQDPDVMLVGEIRDSETASIAIESALTGHLVLSTLHTNDAPSSVSRLIEMGVEPFLVGSALDCVLAQRLARRLCDHCKDEYEPTEAILEQAGFAEVPKTLQRPVGCKVCSNTGYRGRVAIHELMTVTEEIERLAVERVSTDVLKKAAIAAGMRTLREDGMAKVATGVTSLEEILRVIV
ncbi:type II secretion system protein E [bacterium BMS3Abin02]|nr:type II secretion system protein E [bacterium BMS3Abin02]GBE21364.1 type II secretion system protein E [bacterium BMS3Bbin01]HDH24742.1 type II secretion system protein GspE [Actinomycetota bacterium]